MESGGRTDEEGVDVNYEPFELQPSVLEVVARLCPQHEAEEIWRVVGHSLVEQARDLLEEVRIQSYCALVPMQWRFVMVGINWNSPPPQAKSHVEIWRQLKEESDNSVSRGKIVFRRPCSSSVFFNTFPCHVHYVHVHVHCISHTCIYA